MRRRGFVQDHRQQGGRKTQASIRRSHEIRDGETLGLDKAKHASLDRRAERLDRIPRERPSAAPVIVEKADRGREAERHEIGRQPRSRDTEGCIEHAIDCGWRAPRLTRPLASIRDRMSQDAA